MTEAQWFYHLGLRHREKGDNAEAQRIWQALIDAFQDVPSEQAWVRKAQEQLDALRGPKGEDRRQWGPVREALGKIRELRAKGEGKKADEALEALRRLYGKDPDFEKLLRE
jgi:hypothetical protein